MPSYEHVKTTWPDGRPGATMSPVISRSFRCEVRERRISRWESRTAWFDSSMNRFRLTWNARLCVCCSRHDLPPSARKLRLWVSSGEVLKEEVSKDLIGFRKCCRFLLQTSANQTRKCFRCFMVASVLVLRVLLVGVIKN